MNNREIACFQDYRGEKYFADNPRIENQKTVIVRGQNAQLYDMTYKKVSINRQALWEITDIRMRFKGL